MNSTTKEDVCRLCANPGYNYHPIFDMNSNEIVEKIYNCLPIVVQPHDELPVHICNACLEALNVSDKLRSQCLLADSILRKQLRVVITANIKQEKDDNESETENLDTTVEDFKDHIVDCQMSIWTCDLCHDEFKSSEDLTHHQSREHDNEKVFIKVEDVQEESAVDNNKSDTSIENMTMDPLDIKGEHVTYFKNTDEDKQKTYCDICDITITDKCLIDFHTKFHEPRPIFCTQCSRTFPSPYDLYLHKKSVHNCWPNRIKKWICEGCEQFIGNDKYYLRHVKNCRKPKFPCDFCNKEFIFKKEFDRHQKSSHRDILLKDPKSTKFLCDLCGKCLIDKGVCRRHMRRHMAIDEGTHKCPDCGKICSSKTTLKYHTDKVHNRKEFPCNVCFKIFYSEMNLKAHKKDLHNKNNCKLCKKKFDDVKDLDQHLLEDHSTEVPQGQKYSCKECGMSFRKRLRFDDHMNIHTGKKPYSCTSCDKTFRTYAAHWVHQKNHRTSDFICDYCNEKFATKATLRRHLPTHQAPEDWHHKCEICKIKFPNYPYVQRHLTKYKATHLLTCDVCGEEMLGMLKLRAHRSQKHDMWDTNDPSKFLKQ